MTKCHAYITSPPCRYQICIYPSYIPPPCRYQIFIHPSYTPPLCRCWMFIYPSIHRTHLHLVDIRYLSIHPSYTPPPCRCWMGGLSFHIEEWWSYSSCQEPACLPSPVRSRTRCAANHKSCCCHSTWTTGQTKIWITCWNNTVFPVTNIMLVVRIVGQWCVLQCRDGYEGLCEGIKV